MSEPRMIEFPPEVPEVESVEALAELVIKWKRDALQQIVREVVAMLAEENVPRERIAAIAEPSVRKAAALIYADIDSHAARIEREIVGGPVH